MDLNRAHLLPVSPNFKTLYLVRHAQGIHNVELEEKRETVLSHRLFDAKLSPKGLQQVDEQRKQIRESGLLNRIELVISSPLRRTMQTAVGIFGQRNRANESDQAPRTMSDVESTNNQLEQSTIKYPPIIAFELCRERMGLYPCDRRRSISNYRTSFPTIDFSLIETDDDMLWRSDTREELEEVAARGLEFLKWLWKRPENQIAIVSHGIFLQQTLCASREKLGISLDDKLLTRFANCELRYIQIDKRVMEADSFPTQYCRKSVYPLSFPLEPSREALVAEEVSN